MYVSTISHTSVVDWKHWNSRQQRHGILLRRIIPGVQFIENRRTCEDFVRLSLEIPPMLRPVSTRNSFCDLSESRNRNSESYVST